ncbi:hypothetical protein MYSTI_06505 [Myxococcus stipitatus DSM 14675]|uniref:Uncharacterized protein n=1 Tax=Myxococcus stipitatus (strain DSM 14675 / JCM 12634 / Mx s8) TaxID=1278073 RepID=L7UID5_MYXSD|nr:hypothetical protein [Myxococcus stipitatus]AGC47778.1 hypothetical protein MYSTI_06505 [Myxococcus stipitatus DSM 14675]
MPRRITNIVLLKGGKAEIFRYGHDGRQALELLIGGPAYTDAEIRDTLGWRPSESLEDVRSAVCVDFDRKVLVLGGDFGFIRVDETVGFVDEWTFDRMLHPYWPEWTLLYSWEEPLGLVINYFWTHGLVLPASTVPMAAQGHPLSAEVRKSLDIFTMRLEWREVYRLTPPPARLSAAHRDVLLTPLESLSLSKSDVRRCADVGLLCVGDVVSATAAKLDEAGLRLDGRMALFNHFRSELKLDVPTTLPVFLDKAIQRAHGWTLPVELPSEWRDWRRQALE